MNKPYRWLVWKNLLSKLLWWNRGDVGLCNSQPCAPRYCSCLLHYRLSFEESTSTPRVSQSYAVRATFTSYVNISCCIFYVDTFRNYYCVLLSWKFMYGNYYSFLLQMVLKEIWRLPQGTQSSYTIPSVKLSNIF